MHQHRIRRLEAKRNKPGGHVIHITQYTFYEGRVCKNLEFNTLSYVAYRSDIFAEVVDAPFSVFTGGCTAFYVRRSLFKVFLFF